MAQKCGYRQLSGLVNIRNLSRNCRGISDFFRDKCLFFNTVDIELQPNIQIVRKNIIAREACSKCSDVRKKLWGERDLNGWFLHGNNKCAWE